MSQLVAERGRSSVELRLVAERVWWSVELRLLAERVRRVVVVLDPKLEAERVQRWSVEPRLVAEKVLEADPDPRAVEPRLVTEVRGPLVNNAWYLLLSPSVVYRVNPGS